MERVFRLPGGTAQDSVVDAWLDFQPGELGAIAREWYAKLRACGPDVVELMHDGGPVACIEDVPFGYVNVFKAHVNVGFFFGAELEDPGRLLEGTGKLMRHVKLKPGSEPDSEALTMLIDQAYSYAKERL